MKKVAIIGFGVSGQALARYFDNKEFKISVFDSKKETDFGSNLFDNFPNVDFNFEKDDFNEEDFDLIAISPGVTRKLPVLIRAQEKGIRIEIDITIFIDHWRGRGKIVGVTGSNGKTTIVNLIHGYLKSINSDSVLAGNVGNSPLDLLEEYKDKKDVTAVLELSSYQLETFREKHYLDVCVISNLSSNHLDRYDGSMQKYSDAKMNGIDFNKTEIILDLDDEGIKKYVLPKIKSKKITSVSFEQSLDQVINKGVYIDSDNDLVLGSNDNFEKIFVDVGNRKLIGIHNLYNIAMSFAVIDLLNLDICNDNFFRDFEGLEHRIEFVREFEGIKYINDSKSSSPSATKAAIESVSKTKNLILIMGGNDKGMNLDVLEEVIQDNVKEIILLPGDIDNKIMSNFSDILKIEKVKNLEEAINISKNISNAGCIVLLSPSATSFKLYKNYEERGEHFKELVNNL